MRTSCLSSPSQRSELTILPVDLELLTEHVKYIKNEIATTDPFKSGVVREVDPGPDTTSDEAIRGTSHS